MIVGAAGTLRGAGPCGGCREQPEQVGERAVRTVRGVAGRAEAENQGSHPN